MFSNFIVALAAAVGMFIFIYRKTAIRGGGDFKKEIAPATLAALLTFMIMLTLLATVIEN